MRNNYLLALGLAVCAATAGCGGKEAALVGKWKAVNVQLSNNSAAEAQLAKKNLDKMSLEFKPDRHFTFVQEAGTWELKDNEVKMTVLTINGQSLDETKKKLEGMFKGAATFVDQLKNQTATFSPDGKDLSLVMKDPRSNESATFKFEKASS